MIQYEERQRHTDRERGGGGGAEGAKRPRNFIYCPGLNWTEVVNGHYQMTNSVT